MTIHKSQSLSLPCVFADLGNKIFADGMSYVAVSRCLSHKGLYLLNFNPAKVIASDKACNEYRRLLGKGRIHSNRSCKQGKLELDSVISDPHYITGNAYDYIYKLQYNVNLEID